MISAATGTTSRDFMSPRGSKVEATDGFGAPRSTMGGTTEGGAAMLTASENAQLTRVGPGTVMGDLMRQYWMPVVQSSELAAGGRPKRVRLLGEDLVAYRDPDGRAALVSAFCA